MPRKVTYLYVITFQLFRNLPQSTYEKSYRILCKYKNQKSESNLHYFLDITPKRVLIGGSISAAWQHCSKETSRGVANRW